MKALPTPRRIGIAECHASQNATPSITQAIMIQTMMSPARIRNGAV